MSKFFFDKAAGIHKYVLTDYENSVFVPQLEGIALGNLWLQKDGVTCHTAQEIIRLLPQSFSGCLIFGFGNYNWPHISCDVTPLGSFL